MLALPVQFVIFDMEWTAWEGSLERQWSGPNEYREIFEIGALLIHGDTLKEINSFHRFIKLELNPVLPAYTQVLTGITQESIDTEGVFFGQALIDFKDFCQDHPVYSWGTDGVVLAENCQLKHIANPFQADQFHDMRDVFKQHGIPAERYYSSTIGEAFGISNTNRSHQGLNDARNILAALTALRQDS